MLNNGLSSLAITSFQSLCENLTRFNSFVNIQHNNSYSILRVHFLRNNKKKKHIKLEINYIRNKIRDIDQVNGACKNILVTNKQSSQKFLQEWRNVRRSQGSKLRVRLVHICR